MRNRQNKRQVREVGRVALWCVLGLLAFTAATLAFAESLKSDIARELAADAPSDTIGRVYTADAARFAAPTAQAEEGTALRVWCETDDPLPAWWNPSEAELVYQAPIAQPTHGDALDYNLNTTLWGWDGHGMEKWEMDLFARVFYLEFWGTSLPCSEAGCDAILNLWDTGRYGRTLFEALSYYDPDYGYAYRVYPKVWQTDYDADGLAWCKEFCTERFINGPEWSAVYFQLGGYHDTNWVPPLYEMDGVYFSGKGQ